MVRTQGIEFEMNHVGTGVSQVLPILVLGLLSQPDDFLVIEHPELHLHPKVQTRLADFFLFLAMTGRQVLVETHSEYVLSRIRSRIVQDRSGALGAAVAIHFAEREDAETSIREVVINEFGAIEDWPTGFFDEGASEAETIVREALARQNGEGEE
jgi:predicted ATPase